MQGGARVGSSKRGRQERRTKGSRSIRGVRAAKSRRRRCCCCCRRRRRRRLPTIAQSVSPCLSRRQIERSCFPTPPALRGETYTYFIGSFFLSSMASGFARESDERERERSESNLERGRRERVLRRVIFEEVRQNSFFRRQRKGGGAEIKKTPSEIPSLFSLPLSSSQLASFFPLLPPALCSPPEDAGSLSSSRTNWNESRNCCSSSSSHGRAATTAGRRKKRLAASRSGGVESSSLRLRNPWALPP